MGIKVTWDDREHRSIRYIFADDWDWSDVYEAIAESDAWLDQSIEKVPFIIDLRKSGEHVVDKSLGNVRKLINGSHPKTGTVIIVGSHQSAIIQLAKSILAMAQRITGRRITLYFADTLEEAREIVRNEIDFA